MSDHTNLIDAIQNHLQVSFRYKATGEDEATLRVVEPWIYGTRNGKECVYGFQVEGGEVGPRRFDLRRVKTISLTGDMFEQHPSVNDVTKWDEIRAQWSPQKAA